jgi:hypothetical protein
MDRLAESLHTLYAELLDQSIIGSASKVYGVDGGSFVSKSIKGKTYWYVQRLEGDRKRQLYLGPDSKTLRTWMRGIDDRRRLTELDDTRRGELVRMLQHGGAIAEVPAVARVLQIFGDAGVFAVGGVLVGTQAFRAYSNMLGVRLEERSSRTQDIDVAQNRQIALALSEDLARRDLLERLRQEEPRFFAVPGLDPRDASTSFKVRGRDLRVDFLTSGSSNAFEAVELPLFGVSAVALPHLGYVIAQAVQAVILFGSGILVNVPRPARFALHKLWVSTQRSAAERAKARKDVAQATAILEVLASDASAEIEEAWAEIVENHRPLVAKIRSAARALPQEIRDLLAAGGQMTGNGRRE